MYVCAKIDSNENQFEPFTSVASASSHSLKSELLMNRFPEKEIEHRRTYSSLSSESKRVREGWDDRRDDYDNYSNIINWKSTNKRSKRSKMFLTFPKERSPSTLVNPKQFDLSKWILGSCKASNFVSKQGDNTSFTTRTNSSPSTDTLSIRTYQSYGSQDSAFSMNYTDTECDWQTAASLGQQFYQHIGPDPVYSDSRDAGSHKHEAMKRDLISSHTFSRNYEKYCPYVSQSVVDQSRNDKIYPGVESGSVKSLRGSFDSTSSRVTNFYSNNVGDSAQTIDIFGGSFENSTSNYRSSATETKVGYDHNPYNLTSSTASSSTSSNNSQESPLDYYDVNKNIICSSTSTASCHSSDGLSVDNSPHFCLKENNCYEDRNIGGANSSSDTQHPQIQYYQNNGNHIDPYQPTPDYSCLKSSTPTHHHNSRTKGDANNNTMVVTIPRQAHQQSHQRERVWKSAVDPKSGRTYYYDVHTRETQWRKPIELASDYERRILKEKERKQKDFFAAMEANIIKCMHQGQIPGPPRKTEDSLKALPKPSVLGKDKKPDGFVRTISSMDDELLAELIKVECGQRDGAVKTSTESYSNIQKDVCAVLPQVPNSDTNTAMRGPSHGIPTDSFSSSWNYLSSTSGSFATKEDLAIATVRRTADEMASVSVSNIVTPFPKGRTAEKVGIVKSRTPPKGGLKNLAKPSLAKRNTCGTIYVRSTMSAPDKDATIRCVCGVYRAHLIQSAKEEFQKQSQIKFDEYEIFNDHPSDRGNSSSCYSLTTKPTKTKRILSRPMASAMILASETGIETLSFDQIEASVPSLDEITNFYRDVFRKSQMETDCIIMSIIYVERLIRMTNGGVRPTIKNWRSIIFSCMVMSSKVWDDLSMWNVDFSQTCPKGVTFTLKRINELELAVLSCFKYNVKVLASEYAKYYFLLRSMLIRSGLAGEELTSMSPLDVEGAKKLEVVSARFKTAVRAKPLSLTQRSKSMGEVEGLLVSIEGSPVSGGRAHSPNSFKKITLEQVVNM